jgi:hypothetical protein
MIEDNKEMTCEEFQSYMPELIGSGKDASAHPHVQNCALCRALLQDLETIAEAARQLFPVEDPPDRLWEQIESAIKQEDPVKQEEPSRG